MYTFWLLCPVLGCLHPPPPSSLPFSSSPPPLQPYSIWDYIPCYSGLNVPPFPPPRGIISRGISRLDQQNFKFPPSLIWIHYSIVPTRASPSFPPLSLSMSEGGGGGFMYNTILVSRKKEKTSIWDQRLGRFSKQIRIWSVSVSNWVTFSHAITFMVKKISCSLSKAIQVTSCQSTTKCPSSKLPEYN